MKKNIFKPLVLLIIVVAIISLLSAVKPKTYTITLNEGQVVLLYNTLSFAKTAMITSREPASDVHDANVAIDSLQNVIKKQYLEQSDTTNIKKK